MSVHIIFHGGPSLSTLKTRTDNDGVVAMLADDMGNDLTVILSAEDAALLAANLSASSKAYEREKAAKA